MLRPFGRSVPAMQHGSASTPSIVAEQLTGIAAAVCNHAQGAFASVWWNDRVRVGAMLRQFGRSVPAMQHGSASTPSIVAEQLTGIAAAVCNHAQGAFASVWWNDRVRVGAMLRPFGRSVPAMQHGSASTPSIVAEQLTGIAAAVCNHAQGAFASVWWNDRVRVDAMLRQFGRSVPAMQHGSASAPSIVAEQLTGTAAARDGFSKGGVP